MHAGPVDAAYKAIDALVRVPVTLEDYTMNSVTEGITALAVTRVTVRPAADMAESVVTTAQVRCASSALLWSVRLVAAQRNRTRCRYLLLIAYSIILQGRTAQRSFAASAAHEDVVVGSARAYVNALNKLMDFVQSQQQQIAEPERQPVSV